MSRTTRNAALALALGTLTACDKFFPRQPDQSLPALSAVEAIYERNGVKASYQYSGNVVELRVQQPADQLRRGGQLWARVGPYIYLFSPATRELFDTYAGIAGVRVISRVGVDEVARALLVRDSLNAYEWRRARSLLGQALEEGTRRPSTLDRLVQFGEQNTQFEYNPAYVPPQRPGR